MGGFPDAVNGCLEQLMRKGRTASGLTFRSDSIYVVASPSYNGFIPDCRDIHGTDVSAQAFPFASLLNVIHPGGAEERKLIIRYNQGQVFVGAPRYTPIMTVSGDTLWQVAVLDSTFSSALRFEADCEYRVERPNSLQYVIGERLGVKPTVLPTALLSMDNGRVKIELEHPETGLFPQFVLEWDKRFKELEQKRST